MSSRTGRWDRLGRLLAVGLLTLANPVHPRLFETPMSFLSDGSAPEGQPLRVAGYFGLNGTHAGKLFYWCGGPPLQLLSPQLPSAPRACLQAFYSPTRQVLREQERPSDRPPHPLAQRRPRLLHVAVGLLRYERLALIPPLNLLPLCSLHGCKPGG